jgi:hypothetical protein
MNVTIRTPEFTVNTPYGPFRVASASAAARIRRALGGHVTVSYSETVSA